MMQYTVAQRLNMLEQQHQDLKREVARLERQVYLTPDEQRTITDLKKLKLHAKDQLYSLRRQL